MNDDCRTPIDDYHSTGSGKATPQDNNAKMDSSQFDDALNGNAAETEGGLDRLRVDLEEAKDRLMRSQAELENYRKRAAREIEDHRRYANIPLVHDLLPVLDNVERALAAAEKTHDVNVLLEGIKLVAKQFEEVLARHHCTRIAALNAPFDPHLHHAISQQASNDVPPNTVVLVAQAGFQIHDRVVRPSQVIVSRAADNEPSD